MRTWAIISVSFALAAAFFWGWSAFVNVPTIVSGYGTLVTETKNGSTVIGVAPFYAALTKISRLNAIAAACAFFSAFAQSVTLFQGK